jgi:hypothetical protein
MAAKYSDADIKALIEEKKPLPKDFSSKIRLREKRGHKELGLDVQGANGNQFRIVLRQSNYNALDFSIILAFCPTGSNQVFRLRRYNGKSHEHTNTLESDKFYDYHIHTATERYQELGMREDSYAEPSNRFSDVNTAINCMVNDCGFEVPRDPQPKLFEEVLI